MNRGEGQSNLDFLSGLIANMNTSITEKGAVGCKTTNNPLADMLFKIPSYRHDKENFLVDFQYPRGLKWENDFIYGGFGFFVFFGIEYRDMEIKGV